MKAFFISNRNGLWCCYNTLTQPIMAGMQVHAKAQMLITNHIELELSRKFSSCSAMIIHPLLLIKLL